MKNNEDKNIKLNNDDFEDEYFEEDINPKNKIFIALGVLGVLVIVLILVLTLNGKKEEDSQNLQAEILDYAVEEISPDNKENITEINDRLEEESPETPSPEPIQSPEVTQEDELSEEPAASQGPVMELDVKDYSKVKYDTKANLKEFEMYFAANNLEAMNDLSHLDRYIAMSYAFRGTTDFAYYGDVNANGEPNGKGVAVYADNQYYYGDWVDGKREGSGTWVHYHIHLGQNLTDSIVFHEYIGNFKNDLPNGSGQDHYEFDERFYVKNKFYITNYIGSFKDGLIDGEIYCTATDITGAAYEFVGTAKNGSYEYLSESRDKKNCGPVMVLTDNPDGYIWLSPKENKNIGVESYISSVK